jgi:hypothetical protein
MYTPAHSGITPNEYADAIAKAHVMDDVDPEIANNIAKAVTSRPCIHIDTQTGAMCMRRTYRETRKRMGTWIERKLTEGTTKGILAGIPVEQTWKEVTSKMVQSIGREEMETGDENTCY